MHDENIMAKLNEIYYIFFFCGYFFFEKYNSILIDFKIKL
jgi:hypothetical protein